MVLSTTDWAFVGMLYQPLLDVNRGTNLFPHAAKSWTMSADARRFTFTLRPEVRFSDGRPVVASDYIYSIHRVANPRSGSWLQIYCTGIRGYADFVEGRTPQLEGLKSSSPLELVIELSKPDPVFPLLISSFGCAVPKEHVERLGHRFAEAPVGCGPYRVRRWQRGREVVLEQNPFYSGPAHHRFERIEIMIGGDESTHLMMFERGELDLPNLDNGVPLPDFIRLTKGRRSASAFEFFPGFNITYVALNVEIPPLDNLNVRKALNCAIDKRRCLLAGGPQFIAAHGVIPPSVPGYNPSVRGYPFDPDLAQRLLKASGLPLPLKLGLWHRPSQFDRAVCQAIQQDLHAVGVELALNEANDNALNDLTHTRGRIQMSFGDWNPNPDPRDFITTMFDGRTLASPDTMNTAYYNNARVNRLMDAAAEQVDMGKRFVLFQEAEQLIVDDAPWIFLGHKTHHLLRGRGLKGEVLDSFGIYRLDRGWFE